MTTLEATDSPPGGEPELRHRGVAFGLTVEASFALPNLVVGDAVGPPSSRRTSIQRLSRSAMSALKADLGPSRLVFERRFPNDRPMLLVDRLPSGYGIWGARHGRYIVSSDGHSIWSTAPRRAQPHWQRLLFAQVLPLAATLQGLECLHASCVSLDGRAFALTAPSGTGKTSVCLHLVAAGADFVCDDVLAVESGPDGVVAYPGARFVGIDPKEFARIPPAQRPLLGTQLASDADSRFKIFVEPPAVSHGTPLSGIYFLWRGAAARKLEFRSLADARPLLASRFLAYLTDPPQLTAQLAALANVADKVPMIEVSIPDGTSAADVAAALQDHVARGRHDLV